MVNGLCEKWAFTYYVGFDQPMTKDLFYEIIFDLESAGAMIFSSTKDMGGANEGLKKALGKSILYFHYLPID